jgi:hypothetical protein
MITPQILTRPASWQEWQDRAQCVAPKLAESMARGLTYQPQPSDLFPSLQRLLLAMALILITSFGLIPVRQESVSASPRLRCTVHRPAGRSGAGGLGGGCTAGLLNNRIKLRNGLMLG